MNERRAPGTDAPPPPVSPDAYAAIAEAHRAEVGRVIVGQRELVRTV